MPTPSTPFTPAWLAEDPTALALLPGGHRRPEARAAAADRAAARRVHPAVLEAVVATTDAQRARRDELARPGTVAVVTGQQCGLFGGPLYTVYKALAAVVDARALAAETSRPCVPVFWLQDEDHDFAEIASCGVLGADGALRAVSVPERPGDEGRSVASRRLGPEVLGALDELAVQLGGWPHAPATLDLLRRCYVPEASPAAAFRALVEALFAPFGLLVVDPCDPRLRVAAEPVHRRAFQDAARIADALVERSEALRAAGFPVQVHVRAGAPLSFVHPDGPDGPRRRVDGPTEGAFSTSALLRPILQDVWLPTAAYVGGPGEIAYFAQLPPLYACFDLPTPLVVPRARFRVVDEASRRLLDQLGIGADALAEPRDALLARLASPAGEHPDPTSIEAALGPLRDALAALRPHAEALDPGLLKATDKTSGTVAEAVSRLVERYRRVLAERDRTTVERLDRLRARLQPDGAPQERVHGWPSYAARYGVDGFVAQVAAAITPFDGALRELRP